MVKRFKSIIVLFLLIGTLIPSKALAEDTNRIGVLFPLTGPVALLGNWCCDAAFIAAEVINDRGGLWGKKISLVKGDAVDVKAAVSEVTRLISYENLSIIIGTMSSPRATPASEVANRYKRIYWETGAEAERITQRKLDYLFRPFCRSSDKVKPAVEYIVEHVAPTLKKNPEDLRIGIVFEQGDYGTDTANAFMEYAKTKGLKIVTALSHDTASLDFSSDIMRLKGGKLDFLFMPTYVEALGVFWKQAKELGFYAPGGTCASGTVDGLHQIIKGPDVNYHLDCEIPTQVNLNFLNPKQRDNFNQFKKRWIAKFKENPPYVGYQTFGLSMVLFEDVLPRAGSLDPEAVRKAAMGTDIPDGSTSIGYGVKFYPPGHPHQGQNLRSWCILTQYQNEKMVTVWPPKVQVSKPWCPMPSWEERAKKQ